MAIQFDLHNNSERCTSSFKQFNYAGGWEVTSHCIVVSDKLCKYEMDPRIFVEEIEQEWGIINQHAKQHDFTVLTQRSDFAWTKDAPYFTLMGKICCIMYWYVYCGSCGKSDHKTLNTEQSTFLQHAFAWR